jgi:pyruvate dehydrogenase (quinone)
VEYDNPFNMGMTGIFGMESGYHALQACDTLLLLGADFAWSQFYPDKATIQIDTDGSHLGRRHPVALGVVGDVGAHHRGADPAAGRTQRPQLPRRMPAPPRGRRWRRCGATSGPARGADSPAAPHRVIDELAATTPSSPPTAAAPMVWSLRHMSANGRRRTLVSLLHGTMANAMPQALGAQKAYPGRQVISLSGDGGLAMLLGDLMTAVQEKLPIKVVVYNNASLNFVELEQKVEGLLDNYTDLLNPDFARLAEVIGFYGQKVTAASTCPTPCAPFSRTPGRRCWT